MKPYTFALVMLIPLSMHATEQKTTVELKKSQGQSIGTATLSSAAQGSLILSGL